MNWEKFKTQLAQEAHEYFADLREIREGLKSAEGWIALVLLIVAVLMTIAWVIVSLGFNPPNDHITAMMYRFGLHTCRPISNFAGVVVIVDLFLVIFLTVVTFGNVVRMSGRVKRGLPREPRELIISALLMIAAGFGGIVFMLSIC